MKRNHLFNRSERLALKYLYDRGYSIVDMSYRLNRCGDTIRTELARGKTEEIMPNGRQVYSIEQAELKCRRRAPVEAEYAPNTEELLAQIKKLEATCTPDEIIPYELLVLYRKLNIVNWDQDKTMYGKSDYSKNHDERDKSQD